MGPDQPLIKNSGRETVRMLGGLWSIGEGTVEMPDGDTFDSIVTLGFNSQTKRFVGTYVASMMTHLWPYNGTLDPTGRVLTLDSEGPSFADDGTMAKYQDIVEWIDDDHRTLSSRVLGIDGQWQSFMTSHYRRSK